MSDKPPSYGWPLFKEVWRSYHAPLVGAARGAWRAIRTEWRKAAGRWP